MEILKSTFGTTSDNKTVDLYKLVNDKDHSISVITYGGIINKIEVPDRNGNIKNVVLGYNTVKEYEDLSPYFGTITGPFGGRIAGAQFTIDGKTFDLEKNDGNNNLHGGSKSFDKQVWTAKTTQSVDWLALELNYESPDGQFGYPGNVTMYVTYTWDNQDTLTIDYKAMTDKATYLNLTNHSYFNLSGDLTTDITDHHLRIDANKFVSINDEAIPLAVTDVSGTAFDFRSDKPVGKDIEADDIQIKNGTGYDHPFLLNEDRDVTKAFAKVIDPKTGRCMDVYTTEKFVVLYTGNHLQDDNYVFDRVPIKKRGGLCLETQDCPNHMHFKDVPSYVLRPGDTYQSQTKYKFYC